MRIMKLTALIFGCLLTFFTYAETLSSPKSITAKEAVTQMGKGFNLGQMFESNQHPASLHSAKPKIDAYYEKGFRLVRIPVTWTEPLNDITLADPNTGKINQSTKKLEELIAVVDYALSKPDLYVVINAHHEKTLKDQNKANVLEQLWADISDIFKDKNSRLIYQILNEPHLSNHEPMPAENLRHMTSLAYKKIRVKEPNRIIAIGGNQWFAADEMAKVWPNLHGVGEGKDVFLMATFHHYNPWTFNGDNQGDYADNWLETDLSKPMDTMLDWSKNVGNNMPIYIGEWGTGWQSRFTLFNCNNIRLWYSKFYQEFASPRGIPAAVWDDGGWFKIFDHKTNSFDNNLVECINGKCEWDGKERFNQGCK